MEKLHNDFLLIIKNTVLNKKIDFTGMDLESLAKLFKFHSLIYLYVKALWDNKQTVKSELLFEKQKEFMRCATQMAELDEIKNELNKEKIPYLPLKGSIIRTYYSDPAMRSMADLDILVHKDDVKKVKDILLKCGYETYISNEHASHDNFMKKPFMEVEVHRKLVLENAHSYNYLKDIWSYAKKTGDSFEYRLDDNSFYIYYIMHSIKHFSHGGTGVRIFLDLYYMQKRDNTLDFNLISNTLFEYGYDKYELLLRDITSKIFNYDSEITLSSEEELILEYIITSGTYGNIYHNVLTQVEDNSKRSKNKYVLNRLFPDYKTMKARNPVLEKAPFLLPFFWVTRLFKGLFHFKEHNSERKVAKKNISQDAIDKKRKIEEITNIKCFYEK